MGYGSLCSLEKYKDLDEKTLDMLVNEALKFAKGVVEPLNEIGEQQGVKFDKGIVSCPKEFKKAFKLYGEHGWTASARSSKYGGQGFPGMMRIIVKAYCSDAGFKVCEVAMQCLGGYGFCKEYPIEQYLRDVKILSLYEGTNGIQSVDLMGRKMKMNDGKPFKYFKEEIDEFCQKNKEHPTLGDKVRALSGVANRICEIAREMLERQQTDPLQWASYTYPALMSISEIIMVWRLLDMAIIADKQLEKSKGSKSDFFKGKVLQATYYTDTILPQSRANMESCLRHGREIIGIPDGSF